MTKIIEWLLKGPKIIGEIEQNVLVDSVRPDGTPITHLFLQMYLVNKRVDPTTIKTFRISANINGTWTKGTNVHIEDGFKLPGVPVDFPKARLYEIVGVNLMEYGKGVHGWMRVEFVGIRPADIKRARLLIELRDAFNRKHTIRDNRDFKDATEGLMFYPGAGVKGKS